MRLLAVTMLLLVSIVVITAQTPILSNPGQAYNDTDGPTDDLYSVAVSNCSSVSYSISFFTSLPWLGAGNMEYCDELITGTNVYQCIWTGTPCGCDPYNAAAGSCDNCWDFFYVEFILDGVVLSSELVGTSANLDESGTYTFGPICTNGAATAAIHVRTQTWASNESITFSNVTINCWDASATAQATPDPACENEDITLSGVLNNPSSVMSTQWSGPGSISNPASLNTIASGVPAGSQTFTLTTTDANFCTKQEDATVLVTAEQILTSPVIGPYCDDEGPQPLPTMVDGFSGTWSGAGVSGNFFDPFGLGSASPVNITFQPTGCAADLVVPVTISQGVTISLPTYAPICESDSPQPLPTAVGGITGNWSGTGISANTFNPAGLGGSSVAWTFTPDVGQCAQANSINVTITAASILTAPSIGPVCESEAPVVLPTTISTVTGVWSGDGVFGDEFDPFGLEPLSPVTITFTPNAGQCAQPVSTNIVVLGSSSATLSGGGNAAYCTNTPVNLSVSFTGTGPWTFVYSINGANQPAITTSNNPYTLVVSSPSPATVTYDLVSVMSSSCPSGAVSGSVNITYVDPVVADISGTQTICLGEDAVLEVSFTGGTAPYSFVWATSIFDLNPVTTSDNPYIFTVSPTTNTSYYLVGASDFINACPGVVFGLADVDVVPGPDLTMTSAPTVNLCPGQDHTITGSITGGVAPYTIEYTINSTPFSLTTSNTTYSIPLTNITMNTTVVITSIATADCIVTTNENTQINITAVAGSPTVAGPSEVCLNDIANVLFNWSGNTPFDLTYSVDGSSNTVTVNTLPYAIPVTVSSTVTVSFTEVSVNGCTQTINEVWTISPYPNAIGTYTSTLCDGDSEIIEGIIFDQSYSSGSVTIPNGSYHGCDSTLIVNLSFYDPSEENINDMLCAGQTITVFGQVFSESNPSGTATSSGGAYNGCDSIVYVDLTYVSVLRDTIEYTGCIGDGYSITVGSSVYDESNPTGQDVLVSSIGCDSIVTTMLVFNTSLTGEENYTGCAGDGYFIAVGGTRYDEANPTGTELLTSYAGCDSTVTIDLVYNQSSSGTVSYTGCTGDSHFEFVNGVLYDESNPSGSELLVSGAYNGCDSLVTIMMTFLANATASIDTTLCTGGSIVVNGNIYDASQPTGQEVMPNGSYTGCDSVIDISISFVNALRDTIRYNGCLGDGYSITVGASLYNESNPMGEDILTSSLGCDSIVTTMLTFSNSLAGNENYTGCSGDGYSVTVGGVLYDESNPSGTENLNAVSGCDSVVTISLTYQATSAGTLTYTGCTNDGYSQVVNGTVYNEGNPSGTERLIGGADNGCDSIVTIDMTFMTAIHSSIDTALCTGGSVVVNGTTYDSSMPFGQETIVAGSYSGCDSIIDISLNFVSALRDTIRYNGCLGDGYSITVGSSLYNESNPMGEDILTSSSGCDSIVTTMLTFSNSLAGNENYTGCSGDGYSVTVGGVLYDESNPSGTENLVAASGCDSVVTISLTYQAISAGTLTYTGCTNDGYSQVVNGTVYNEGNPSGTERLIGGAYSGCDSIVTIDLMFLPSSVNTFNQQLCVGQSITINGTIYNETNPSGTETLVGQAVSGCDSIINISLQFGGVITGAPVVYNGCSGDGYSVIVNGTTYDESLPTGQEVLASSTGCDSIVDIDLVFNDYLAIEVELSGDLCVSNDLQPYGNFVRTITISGNNSYYVDLTINNTGSMSFLPTYVGETFTEKIQVLDGTSELIWYEVTAVDGIPNNCYSLTQDTVWRMYNPSLYIDWISDYNGFDVSCADANDGSLMFKSLLAVNPIYQVDGVMVDDSTLVNLPQGDYMITLIDDNLCVDSTIVTLSAPEPLVLDAAQLATDCTDPDIAILVSDVDGGVGPYALNINGEASNFMDAPQVIGGLDVGDYTLILSDANDCTASTDITLNSSSQFTVDLGADKIVQIGDSVIVSYQSGTMLVDSLVWVVNGEIQCVNCQQLVLYPTSEMIIRLYAYSGDCMAEDRLQISIAEDIEYFIPNVFSPDGDGSNDYLEAFFGDSKGKITSARVFDRWGNQLYEAINLPLGTHVLLWDGNWRDEQAQPAVYVYVLEVEYLSGKKEIITGDITLVR